jgi:hypothetical protein
LHQLHHLVASAASSGCISCTIRLHQLHHQVASAASSGCISCIIRLHQLHHQVASAASSGCISCICKIFMLHTQLKFLFAKGQVYTFLLSSFNNKNSKMSYFLTKIICFSSKYSYIKNLIPLKLVDYNLDEEINASSV